MTRQKIYQKVNTFSRAPSLAQICSYTVITLQTILFYLMIRPNIKSQLANLVLTIMFSLSLAILIITCIMCSVIDPSDTAMMQSKSGKKKQQFQVKFNISQLLYCEYCQTYVTSQAKHCRQCDRCVQNFDHHCMWINNCVGSKNYTPFIIMITSTCINLSIYIASVVVLSVEKQWMTFLGFIITCWVVLVIVFVLWFLLFNLNLLHIYLMCKGYTTYQFIIVRKQQERQRQYEKAQKQVKLRQQRLKTIVNKSRKILQMQIVPETQNKIQQNIKIQQNNSSQQKTPKKSSIQLEQDTNSIIKMKQTKNKQTVYDKDLETTTTKMKNNVPITQDNQNNVIFNGFENNQNEDAQSIKIDALSIKGDNIGFDNKIVNNQNQLIESQSQNQSIRISQFFIRNKSFNILLQSQADSPHKKVTNTSIHVQNPSKQKVIKQSKQPKSRLKSKSSSSQAMPIKKLKEQLQKNKKK